MGRKLDAFCDSCDDVRVFELQDPGSCKCKTCGHIQQMYEPVAP